MADARQDILNALRQGLAAGPCAPLAEVPAPVVEPLPDGDAAWELFRTGLSRVRVDLHVVKDADQAAQARYGPRTDLAARPQGRRRVLHAALHRRLQHDDVAGRREALARAFEYAPRVRGHGKRAIQEDHVECARGAMHLLRRALVVGDPRGARLARAERGRLPACFLELESAGQGTTPDHQDAGSRGRLHVAQLTGACAALADQAAQRVAQRRAQPRGTGKPRAEATTHATHLVACSESGRGRRLFVGALHRRRASGSPKQPAALAPRRGFVHAS